MSLRRQPPRPRRDRPAGGTRRRMPGLPSGRSTWTRRRRPAWPSLPGLRLPSIRDRLRPVRAGFSPARAGALLALLMAGGALYGAGASDGFGYAKLELSGLRWTAEAAVRALVGVPDGTNLFAVRTRPIADRIARLPSVASARVDVHLPDTLAIRVTEREAVLAWRVGDTDYLTDRDGTLFAGLGPDATAAAGLAVVVDARAAAVALRVGSAIDPVDLDAATRLASLVPADVGSAAERLAVSVTDANGFVVASLPDGWTAIFGFYTPNLRTTELIPGQVRLLRSLLDGQEAGVAQVILADDRNGTYVPRPTPAATPVPSPPP